MPRRKKTLRRMRPHTRALAKLADQLQSMARRLDRQVEVIKGVEEALWTELQGTDKAELMWPGKGGRRAKPTNGDGPPEMAPLWPELHMPQPQVLQDEVDE